MDNSLVFAPYVNGMSDLASVSWFMTLYRDRGFTIVNTYSLRRKYYLPLLDYLNKIEGIKIVEGGRNRKYTEFKFKGWNFVVYIQNTHGSSDLFLIVTSDATPEVQVEFTRDLPIFEKEEEGQVPITCYYKSTAEGVTYETVYADTKGFSEIYLDLYPDVDIDLLLEEYSSSREPILILYGEPGTGKTSLIKKLVASKHFDSVAYAKDPFVMNDGQFWSYLTSHDYDLIILDDLDLQLLPRKKNEDGIFMTQLLSYSDGIFSSKKTKIVITTNQSIKEIDRAMVRPGRCFDFIPLNPISYEFAKSFWESKLGLPLSAFNNIFTTEENITQANLMSEAFRYRSTKSRGYIKNGSNQYNLDDKIRNLGIRISEATEGSVLFK